MTKAKIVARKMVRRGNRKSVRCCPAFILTTLMLVVAVTTVAATAQTYTDLYDFNGNYDGANPVYPSFLAQGRDGNLYGTTSYGGTNNLGIVFRITPDGALTVLYNFDGVHGFSPNSGLTLGTDGNLYGTTWGGGNSNLGTIYRITTGGKLTTLYNFTGSGDGNLPYTPPIQGADGNFYGTTENPANAYKITPSGSFTSLGWLHAKFAHAPLLLATDGNFYGATYDGGPNNCGQYNCGTVFRLTPKGVFRVVHNFDGAHGANPVGALVQSSDGNFYGTTRNGGDNGSGVVYRLTPQGDITVLHSFGDPNYLNDGARPYTALVPATDGDFYGVTSGGGDAEGGVIFRITSSGQYTILYYYDGPHGAQPTCTPMQHSDGTMYGLAGVGGAWNNGVVYSLDMDMEPFVKLVRDFGLVGGTGGILGRGFTGTTAVSLNGTPTNFTVVSDTYLTATVPAGATTGPVTVSRPNGTLTSNKPFRITPQLLNFDPPSGPVGTLVTITGNSLTQTQEVGFGNRVPAQFTVDSDRQVTATVPQGAKTGKVGIQTQGGTAISAETFTVTP